MKIPSINEAKAFLEEAEKMNPGKWISHSLYAAEAAQRIARLHPSMDSDAAYILGMLHDIGRRSGLAQMRHIIDGYKFMSEKGYTDAARICLTHSFPYKETDAAAAKWDCSQEDRLFIDSYLSEIEYNSYDKLIQLCDYLALPTGFCLIEKRMIDVAMRYGTNGYSTLKWKAVFDIKDEFEKEVNCSIYSILPGVIETTFE